MVSMKTMILYDVEFKSQNRQKTHQRQKDEKLVSQINKWKMQT